MEVLVISSAMVLLMHIMLPAMLMKDVQSVRDKLTQSILQYHQRLNHHHHKYVQNGEEKGRDEADDEDNEDKSFNAAEYLFVSYRMAKEFSKLTISKIILQYRSPWPRRSYQYSDKNMTKQYGGRFSALYRSMGLLLIFVLTNLLNVPVNVQDMIIKSITTVVIGYLLFVQTQLYAISPALVVVPYLILFAIVVLVAMLMIRWFGCGNNTLPTLKKVVDHAARRLSTNIVVLKPSTSTDVEHNQDPSSPMQESVPSKLDVVSVNQDLSSQQQLQQQGESRVDQKQHMTRRQSVQMGVGLLRLAKNQIEETSNSEEEGTHKTLTQHQKEDCDELTRLHSIVEGLDDFEISSEEFSEKHSRHSDQNQKLIMPSRHGQDQNISGVDLSSAAIQRQSSIKKSTISSVSLHSFHELEDNRVDCKKQVISSSSETSSFVEHASFSSLGPSSSSDDEWIVGLKL
jgi:hypothetical protein